MEKKKILTNQHNKGFLTTQKIVIFRIDFNEGQT
jgi:hypothetical protein